MAVVKCRQLGAAQQAGREAVAGLNEDFMPGVLLLPAPTRKREVKAKEESGKTVQCSTGIGKQTKRFNREGEGQWQSATCQGTMGDSAF